MKGYIKIDRSFFDSEDWRRRRRFSTAEARLDIQRRVFFADSANTEKGEVKLNMRKTAISWGWHVSEVHKFIHRLVSEGMLTPTDKKSTYKAVNKNVNKNVNTENRINTNGSGDSVNKNVNKNVNTPPFIKEEYKKECAREDESVALANEKEARFEAFRRWAADNIPTLAPAIDYCTYQMMLGQAYGHSTKMASTLKGMEEDHVNGTPKALMKEYERRCPR